MKTISARIITILLAACICITCQPCVSSTAFAMDIAVSADTPYLYLYGESHGSQIIMEKEWELWNDYYHTQNMRHLFMELPFYTAEYLNLWMQAEDDAILDTVYEDWNGSALYNPDYKTFLKKIKEACPDTIFHGTDVGHQFNTTGQRYLKLLRDSGKRSSIQYQKALNNAEQGAYFYATGDFAYREIKMSENFIQEYELLKGQPVMGIYGTAHISMNVESDDETIPFMASQLQTHFGYTSVSTEDLSFLANTAQAIRIDHITVNGREYNASYYGIQDLTGLRNYSYREFWRLEDAYEDFKNLETTGDVLPYNNYPMQIQAGQVFIIDYVLTDGSKERQCYLSDGTIWNGRPSTVQIIVNYNADSNQN